MSPSMILSVRKVLAQWQEVWRISWPLIIANGFWNLQITIDRIYLGNYSTEALGAAVAVMGVFWAPMALAQQTPAYVMSFVAQYFGARRFEMIGPAVWQSIYICIAGGLIFLLFIPITPVVFEWIGHSESVRVLEIEYFKALTWSALPMALVAAASGFFTGLGKSRVIIWINFSGLIANVIFDYVLIFGNWGFPALGVEGAGYATALASWASAILGFVLVFGGSNEKDYSILSGWRFRGDLMKRFLRYGLPSGLQWSLEGLSFTVFLIFVGLMPNGGAALAASGIAITIMMLSIIPMIGVGQGVSVLVGQYLGNNQPDRAEIVTWNGVQLASTYIMTCGLTFLVFPEFYLNWFHNPEDAQLWQEVSYIVPFLLMYIALFTCFDSLNLVLSFALKGAGDTRFVTLVALLLPWPLMVIPTWYTKEFEGAIFWAWGFASLYIIVQALIFLGRFRGGKWRHMRVID